MAEAVTSPPDALPSRRRARPRTPFLLAYVLLALILGAAAAAFAVLVTRSESTAPASPQPQWSLWRPTATGLEGAQQIANFVARRYRLPGGEQLVAVKAGPFAVEDVRISAVAIRTREQGDPDILVAPVGAGVVYAMCGGGKRCSIAVGKPSQERGRLVRREALELALYTFAYLKDVESVVVFLPPPGDTTTSFLLYFRRGDLEELLARPLTATLPEGSAPLASEIGPVAAQLIDQLTLPHVYAWGFQQLQDGTVLLALSPLALED